MGVKAAILDSLKLKKLEDSGLLTGGILSGVNPVLVFEVCEALEVFERLRIGEFRMGDMVRHFVGVSEPLDMEEQQLSLESLRLMLRLSLRRCTRGLLPTS